MTIASTARKAKSPAAARKRSETVARTKENTEQYFTMSDVAKRLGMSRQTLYTHVQAGRIKPQRFGRYAVLSESEVQKFATKLRTVRIGGEDKRVLAFT